MYCTSHSRTALTPHTTHVPPILTTADPSDELIEPVHETSESRQGRDIHRRVGRRRNRNDFVSQLVIIMDYRAVITNYMLTHS